MSNGYDTKTKPGAEFFLHPDTPAQRQYEALRAYLVDGQPAAVAAQRFGYTPATLYSLSRDLRAGRLHFFDRPKPGPKRAPKRDPARDRVLELRKQNYSVYDIQAILKAEGRALSHTAIHRILQEEGFAKLPRRRADERPPVPRPDVAEVADIGHVDWKQFARFETQAGGLFLFLPALLDWGLADWVRKAKLPGSQMIPALQSVLSLLSLKLTGKERISHVMEVCLDPGFALFAGLNVIPKTTALSTYSYRVTRDMIASLLRSYVETLPKVGLLPGNSFNLDFHVSDADHAIPYRGTDEHLLQKHYISQRSRRERAVMVFLVQDDDSRALCYANATVRKDDAADEILRFVEFWEETRGQLPPHLVFDSQLTTYVALDKLDQRGIRFVTLRRRGPKILRQLRELPKSDWKRIKLQGVSRLYSQVRYVESPVALRPIRNPLRQLAVDGLGRDEPTLLLTNDFETKPAHLVERYAHRMIIVELCEFHENNIAENIDFFHLDALSSAVAMQVDLDVMLTLIANGLYRQLAHRIVGFEAAHPKQLFRRFLNAPARVSVDDQTVRVRLTRRTHHPLLLASGALEPTPAIPWWHGRQLQLEIR